MKKEQRLVYLELSDEAHTTLCAFCKFSGGGDCESWDGCNHPLNKEDYKTLSNHGNYWDSDPEPGEDCWGFRPKYPVDIVADIVGIVLAYKFGEWFYAMRGDGVIVVHNQSYLVGKKQDYVQAII